MGIQCEINLNKPENGTFIPGSVVSCTIKYVFDEETSIKRITVSLKGSGYLHVTDKRSDDDDLYTNKEIYVDTDDIIQQDHKVFSPGAYVKKFSFLLPSKAPPSLHFYRLLPIYDIHCVIGYYIRIKFERSGFFTPNNHFRKDIPVASAVDTSLPTTSAIENKKNHVIRLTSRSDDVVKVEGNVETCVITSGGKIELSYEIVNDSKVIVLGIEFVLMETYTFQFRNRFGENAVKVQENIINTDSKLSSVDIGHTKNMCVVIDVSKQLTTIENSNIVSRDYCVKMTILLPPPHLNSIINIPVKIGDHINGITPTVDRQYPSASTSAQYCPSAPPAEDIYDDQPPSYWEIMGEHKTEDKNQKNFA